MSINQSFEVPFTHRLRMTRDALSPANTVLRDVLLHPERTPTPVLVFIDDGLLQATPMLEREVRAYFDAYHAQLALAGPVHHVPGGEKAKNCPDALDCIHRAIHEAGLCRQSCIIVIGGGAVLDAVGFAAAIAHRGIRLVRLPTTTLAQADSGVGVKNGVNRFGKKNYHGVFAPPWAVINDQRFLEALDDRDWRAGFAEAVKVALIKDAAFFELIESSAQRIAQRDLTAGWTVVSRSAQLHMDHITTGGDPFEMTTARPLDFGHWSAHRLEAMTSFRLRHGEAVAVGVALDAAYAMLTGMLDKSSFARIAAVLDHLHLPVYDRAMDDVDALLVGLEEFREHLGGRLTIAMLEAIGRRRDVHEIDHARMRMAIDLLADRASARRRVS